MQTSRQKWQALRGWSPRRRVLLFSGAVLALLTAALIFYPGLFGIGQIESLYRSRQLVRSGAHIFRYVQTSQAVGVSGGGYDIRTESPGVVRTVEFSTLNLVERVYLPLASKSNPPDRSEVHVIAGAGNIAGCGTGGDEETSALLDRVFSSGSPGTVITLGDNVIETGSLAEYEACYSGSWGRYNASVRPAPGNREYSGSDRGYFDYFGDRAGESGDGWYSYDLGTWHILSLNSMCGRTSYCKPGSDQFKWLEKDLADNAGLCTLAYFHHPLFSSSQRGSYPSLTDLWQLLYRYGVELILNGHDAFYERFAPQDPFGNPDPDRGIRQITVGTGGMQAEPFGLVAPNSEVRITDILGIIRVALEPGEYSWEFIATPEGAVLDSGQAACH